MKVTFNIKHYVLTIILPTRFYSDSCVLLHISSYQQLVKPFKYLNNINKPWKNNNTTLTRCYAISMLFEV